MAKKSKSTPSSQPKKQTFNPETSQLFTPVVFLLIFLSLMVLFSDFVFSDKMLHGSDMLQAGIFFRSFLVDYVSQYGSVPQWNPYIFGGMPYVEAFHGDIFYPLSAIKFFGSIYRMLGWVMLLHIFLAGIFMYLTARQFKLSKVASLLAGISYMFASYLISLVAPGHDGKIFVTTLFPLTILFVDRGFEPSKFMTQFFNFSMLGLVIGLIILSPHPQMSYYSLWAIAFYAAFKIIYKLIKDKSIKTVILPGSLTAYAVVVGLLLSAIQFYPGYSYTTEFSPRSDSKKGWEWATSWSMHEEEAFSLLIPEFSGVRAADKDYGQSTFYWGKNYFKDNSESVRVVALFIALFGLFFYRRKEAYFFTGLALFAFVYALGGTTPIFKLFFYLIPKVQSLRAPSMIMFLFSFSIALLAGMGLQAIIDKGRAFKAKDLKKFNYILFGFPLFMLLLALLFSVAGRGMLDLWSSLFYGEASTQIVQQNITKLDVGYMNLPAITTGAWLSFVFTALAALFIWLYQTGRAQLTILLFVLLLPLVNGVRFNNRFIEADDINQYFSENPIIQYLKNIPGQFRVMNLVTRMIPEDLLPYHKIEVVTGYHGNQLKWYDELLGGQSAPNQLKAGLMNVANAEYLLLPAGQTFPPNYFGSEPVTNVAKFGQIEIYKNQNALPRLFISDQYKVYDDASKIFTDVLSNPADLKDVVYLEEKPQLPIVPDSVSTDSVWVVDYLNDSILINTEISSNKLLVLTDNYYESWHVYVDGLPGRVLRAYGTFRAVELPSGTKEVLFKYKSEKYQRGRTITLATTFYLVIVLGLYLGFGRKKDEIIEDELA